MSTKRKIEIVVVVLVIVLSVVFVWMRKSTSDQLKQSALIDELRATRLAVGLYQEMNKAYPADLKILLTQKATIAGKDKPYLTGIKVGKDGEPVDSFGKKFNYDAKSGKVTASEPKYSNW